MSLLTTGSITVIDRNKIAKGDFIRAKYHSWEKTHNGIVAEVTVGEIRVFYIGDGGNMTNYFEITADEIANGLWEISWSSDLTETQEEGDGE